MKFLLRFLCISILLSIPMLSFSDLVNKPLDTGWNVTGKVISIDKDGATVDIHDSKNVYYSVNATHALIYIGAKEGKLSDLHRGDDVQVFGLEQADHSVDARSIYKLVPDAPQAAPPQEKVRVLGTIMKMDALSGSISLKTNAGLRNVLITGSTEIYSTEKKKVNLSYLREGINVDVEGFQSGKTDISATTIRAEKGIHTIQVKVLKCTNRMFSVSPVKPAPWLHPTFDVKAAKKVSVIKSGRTISLKKIKVGDFLDLDGKWDGSAFIADRITLNESGMGNAQKYQSLDGCIKNINKDQTEFVLRANDRDWKVYADRARVWENGNLGEFEDLRVGDSVSVRGNIQEDSVDAERVEVR